VRCAPHGRARRRRLTSWWPVLLVSLTMLLVNLGGSAANGGFTAKITNTASKAQTASLLTAAAAGGSTECDLSTAAYTPVSAGNTAGCTGTLFPAGSAPASGTGATATLLTDKGSVAASALRLTKGTCGAVQLANSKTGADPMLVRGNTLSYAQTGPLTASTGLGLSGSSGFAAEVKSAAAPTTFTEAIWFKAAANGTLLGFTTTSTTISPTSADRMLWVDSTGHVVFGVTSGSAVELTSPAATYLDNNWHLAAGTVAATGMTLSIDGATVATNSAITTVTSYAGYWHAGWDNLTSGWSDPPTTAYFNGTLADAAIFPPLTAAKITALYTAGTQTTWASLLSTDAATGAWILGDAGTTAFTGTIPNVTPNACAFIDVTVGATGATTNCAAPASSSACGAPTSALTMATLAASTTISNLPTPSQTVTVTATIARDATDTIAAYPYATGLHLTAAATLTASSSTFTATLNWPAENIVL
jgi:hypothetical protein